MGRKIIKRRRYFLYLDPKNEPEVLLPAEKHLKKVKFYNSQLTEHGILFSLILVLIVWLVVGTGKILIDAYKRDILIDKIYLSSDVTAGGITPERVAFLISEEIRNVHKKHLEIVSLTQNVKAVTTLLSRPEPVTFSLPGSGVSLESLSAFIKSFANWGALQVSVNIEKTTEEMLATLYFNGGKNKYESSKVVLKRSLNDPLFMLMSDIAENILSHMTVYDLVYSTYQSELDACSKSGFVCEDYEHIHNMIDSFLEDEKSSRKEKNALRLLSAKIYTAQKEYGKAVDEYLSIVRDFENCKIYYLSNDAYIHAQIGLADIFQIKDKKVEGLKSGSKPKYNSTFNPESQYNLALKSEIENKDLVYMKLAQFYISKEKYSDAEKQINLAEKLNPNSSYPYVVHGNILETNKKYNEAIKQLETAVKMDPDDFYANLRLASLLSNYCTYGDNNKCINMANEYFIRAFQQDSKNEYSRIEYAKFLMKLDRDNLNNLQDVIKIFCEKINTLNVKCDSTFTVEKMVPMLLEQFIFDGSAYLYIEYANYYRSLFEKSKNAKDKDTDINKEKRSDYFTKAKELYGKVINVKNIGNADVFRLYEELGNLLKYNNQFQAAVTEYKKTDSNAKRFHSLIGDAYLDKANFLKIPEQGRSACLSSNKKPPGDCNDIKAALKSSIEEYKQVPNTDDPESLNVRLYSVGRICEAQALQTQVDMAEKSYENKVVNRVIDTYISNKAFLVKNFDKPDSLNSTITCLQSIKDLGLANEKTIPLFVEAILNFPNNHDLQKKLTDIYCDDFQDHKGAWLLTPDMSKNIIDKAKKDEAWSVRPNVHSLILSISHQGCSSRH